MFWRLLNPVRQARPGEIAALSARLIAADIEIGVLDEGVYCAGEYLACGRVDAARDEVLRLLARRIDREDEQREAS